MKKKLLIMDSHSIIYKCFFGVRPMTSPSGTPTNAIFGFVNILTRLIKEHNPDYIYAAFDKGKKTFRHDFYSAYKDGRQSMPEELREQIPIIQDILNSLDIPIISIENYEADDIIGSVTNIAKNEGVNSIIVTGDKDSFQLVREGINVLYTKRGVSDTILVDEEYIFQTYEVWPKQLIEVKALMGDKSDNIPGVMGVGEKTALSLIKEYSTLENVYENIENIKGKLKEKLEQDKENAFLSRRLGTIDKDMDLEVDFSKIEEVNFKSGEFAKILTSLDFQSIMKKLDIEKEEIVSNKEETIDFSVFENYKDVTKDNIKDILKSEFLYVYFDYEEKLNSLRGVSIFDGKGYYYTNNLEIIKDLREYKGKMITHNYKEIYKYFLKEGIDLKCYFDTFIAAYVIDPSDERYSIEVLAFKYLDISIEAKKEKQIQQSLFDNLSEDKESNKEVILRSYIIYKLYEVFYEKIKEYALDELYFNIEHKLIFVLARMEKEGFRVDVEVLKTLEKDFDERVYFLTKEIREIAGEEESFNINSPKQLGVVLFEKLNLPVIKKTKTGYSTDIDVLEKLRDHHPIIDKIIVLRQLSKLNSTYVKGLLKIVDKNTSKIHSTFNQTITTTGRISSSNPNLQNIPIRTPEGRVIRKVFIPESEDNVLIGADYSQIELRILAHIAGDEKLIEAFMNEEDIHTKTASEVFNVSKEDVSSSMRYNAKAVNFGIIYGISDFSLAKDLNITRAKAKEYIEEYLKTYPKVKEYMENTVAYARENGYVKTLYNRRRYLPQIHSKNFNIRSFNERTALNTPIQGSAADIIKIAMINVDERLRKLNLRAKLILQVHDELIIDTPTEEIEIVKGIIREEMENATVLKCPLKADISLGKSWFEAK